MTSGAKRFFLIVAWTLTALVAFVLGVSVGGQ
jgi:hypothetical protein